MGWLSDIKKRREEKKAEREREETGKKIEEGIKRTRELEEKWSAENSNDPYSEFLGYMDGAMDRLNNSRATQMEQTMASQMAGELLSEIMPEQQQAGKKSQFKASLKEEVDSKEIAENARRQEIRNEYIRNHPYARIMDELLRHVKAKEEGRESTYSGTSKESVLAQYRYDNDRSKAEINKLSMFIPYIYEIEKSGGSISREMIPNALKEYLDAFQNFSQEDKDSCLEGGIQFMHYYEIIDKNGIDNLEFIRFTNPYYMENDFSSYTPCSVYNQPYLGSLPKEYERYISGNTK